MTQNDSKKNKTTSDKDLSLELMNVQETAEFLRLKVSTLYTWVYQKKIPHIKLYGKLLFNKQELVILIASNNVAQGF